MFWKRIWNGTPAGAVTASCSYLTPRALIVTRLAFAEPLGAGGPADAAELGAGVLEGAGAYVQPGLALVQAATKADDSIRIDRRRA